MLGIGVLCIAYAALRLLLATVHPGFRHEATPRELGLAAIAFLGASVGSNLLLFGRHLFDQVEVSSRWSRHHG